MQPHHGQYPSHGIRAIIQDQFFTQIHQTAALGVNRKTVFGQVLQFFSETHILRQSLGVGFRKTTADVKGIELRDGVGRKGAKKDDFSASG